MFTKGKTARVAVRADYIRQEVIYVTRYLLKSGRPSPIISEVAKIIENSRQNVKKMALSITI